MEHIFEILIMIICVGGAVTYLVKTLFLNKSSGCGGGCNKCETSCKTSIKHFDNKTIKINSIK